jgi:hypothetical protein
MAELQLLFATNGTGVFVAGTAMFNCPEEMLKA